MAQRAGVKTLVLTHLSDEIDTPDTRDEVLREVQQIFEGRVVWGEDLMELKLEAP